MIADDTQLHQVLLNLCVNARDVMPDGGTLWFESDSVDIEDGFGTDDEDFKPGSYFVWRVRDNGMGMTPNVLKRIFDSFFKTKDFQKGTGLGLSILMGVGQRAWWFGARRIYRR